MDQIHPKLSDRSHTSALARASARGVALLVLAELAAAEWAPVPLGELALHPFELCALRANASPAAAMDDAELRARCSRRDAGPPALFTLPAVEDAVNLHVECNLNSHINPCALAREPSAFARRWREDDDDDGGAAGRARARAFGAAVERMLRARFRLLVFWGDSTMWHDAHAVLCATSRPDRGALDARDGGPISRARDPARARELASGM